MTDLQASLDIDLSQVKSLGNRLLDKLAELQAHDPIYYSQANGGMWIVTGHAEVSDGFSGRKPLTARRLPQLIVGQIPEEDRAIKIPYMLKTLPQWVFNMDRPAQWRLRSLAMKAFSSASAEAMRPYVRTYVKEALTSVAGLPSVEFVDRVARLIPARTILRTMGLSEDLYPCLHGWSVALNEGLGGVNLPEAVLVRCEKALLEMRDVFLVQIEARRRAPGDDFISALVTARDASDKLSDEEMLGLLYVALIAGHETTANTIALGTAALAVLPDAMAYMRNHPERIAESVMELMRYIAMSTMQSRVATEDFVWNGHQIRQGEHVLFMIAAANRDPSVFVDPNVFDGDRSQVANMVFGVGQHFCIGHYLAKVQVHEYFDALVRTYNPVILDERLAFGHGATFRGVDTLHLRLDPFRPIAVGPAARAAQTIPVEF